MANLLQKIGTPYYKIASVIIGPRRTGDISACWADTTKINTTIGWRAQRTIDDAMKDAWEWQKMRMDRKAS